MRPTRLPALALAALLLATGSTAAQAIEPDASSVRTSLAPNAERPLTHQELLTVRGERAQSDWGTAMVVADAVIGRSDSVRAKAKGAGIEGGPAFGVLPREDQPGDPVVQARKDVRAQYPDDSTDVRGLMAIEILDQSMELRGTVATPNGTYLTPIEPAAMAVADSLPIGALIVARGWLSRLDRLEPCPAVPESIDRGDSGGTFSPFVRCPGGWLTTGPVSDADLDDPLTPAAFGIPVQHGALARFTHPRHGGPVTGATSYLLEHVANPIDAAEPTSGWEVIGRLEAAEKVSDLPTAAGDIATPGGLDWEPALGRQPPADRWWTHTTAWDGGFASVHTGRDRVLSAWVSSDGHSWRGASLPHRITHVAALLPLQDRLALIANDQPFTRAWQFEVWTSADGLAWERASRRRISAPKGFRQHRRMAQGYYSLGDEIVAIETYTTQRCCGGRSGSTFLATSRRDDATFTWSSTNGRHWSRARTRGIPKGSIDLSHGHISQGEDQLLALWGDSKHTIGRSTDGVRWRSAGRYPPELDLYSPSVLARSPDGWILAGEPNEGGNGEGNFLAIWTGTLDGEWERTYERLSSVPASITVSGETVIIAGSQLDLRDPELDPPPDFPWLLVSEDGGSTWDEARSWTGKEDWCLRDLTKREGTLVLDAVCAPPGAASKYALELTLPAAAVPTPRQVLQCDARREVHSVRDEWDDDPGFETPDAALETVLHEGFVIPVAGYRELARNADAILYGFRNRDRLKVAVRVKATESGGWTPEWLADCPLTEYGPDADMGPGVWLWADRSGSTIQERRGPAHCRLQSMRFLWWPTNGRDSIYIRDPEGQFRDRWQAPYLRSTSLPATVRKTGYRRDGATIWMARDRNSIYIKRGSVVERWPRIPRNAIGCA